MTYLKPFIKAYGNRTMFKSPISFEFFSPIRPYANGSKISQQPIMKILKIWGISLIYFLDLKPRSESRFFLFRIRDFIVKYLSFLVLKVVCY